MKQIILACLILFPLTGVMAQETTRRQTIVNTSGDSIIIRKGDGDVKIKVYEEVTTDGDAKQEEKLFEGVYLTRIDTDRPSILDALPFAPKKRNRFDPHSSGLYMGFSSLSNDFYSFSASDRKSVV